MINSTTTTPINYNIKFPVILFLSGSIPNLCYQSPLSLSLYASHSLYHFIKQKAGSESKEKATTMSGNKVSNFTDLIQRVTASCLLHPLGNNRFDITPNQTPLHKNNRTRPQIKDLAAAEAGGTSESDTEYHSTSSEDEEQQPNNQLQKVDEPIDRDSRWDERELPKVASRPSSIGNAQREAELVALMSQVFDVISEVKRSYANLQEAHCPWDPDKMRVADAAVIGELKKIGVLRERFRRGFLVGDGNGSMRMKKRNGVIAGGVSMREVVGPYEAAVSELQGEVKVKDMEIKELKEKLKGLSWGTGGGNGRKGRTGRHGSRSGRKVGSTPPPPPPLQVLVSPSPDLFGSTMNLVIDSSKSFTNLLLSLMRSAHWDIAAATRSIEAAISTATDPFNATSLVTTAPPADLHRAKYALESYVSRKMFLGFDHETFYMDGTLLSLIDPKQFRKDCFSKFHDMKSMDPAELLGITPTCQFGVFCSKKYLAIVHPNMEESLFGDLEMRRQVVAGVHPRTGFYREFLGLAKAVWLLHLLAFSLEPAPNHFEASKGAEFNPMYMESVARFPGGKVPGGLVVGFPVSPGFKLGNGSIVKARVYLVPRQ